MVKTTVMGINADSHWFVWHKTVTERYIDNWAGFVSWFIHGEQDKDGFLNCSHISLLASTNSMVGNQECFKQMFIVHAAIKAEWQCSSNSQQMIIY